jgi:Uma2 family endonuclease
MATTVTSAGNALTVEDLEAMSDDGRRYELIGGAIVVTPAPEPVHQRVSGRLFVLLQADCPRVTR